VRTIGSRIRPSSASRSLSKSSICFRNACHKWSTQVLPITPPCPQVLPITPPCPPQQSWGGKGLGGSGGLHGDVAAVQVVHEPHHPQPQRPWSQDAHGEAGQRAQRRTGRDDVERSALVHTPRQRALLREYFSPREPHRNSHKRRTAIDRVEPQCLERSQSEALTNGKQRPPSTAFAGHAAPSAGR
jgi:hypothetical protein